MKCLACCWNCEAYFATGVGKCEHTQKFSQIFQEQENQGNFFRSGDSGKCVVSKPPFKDKSRRKKSTQQASGSEKAEEDGEGQSSAAETHVETQNVPVSTSKPRQSRLTGADADREYLVDSGASFHLIGKDVCLPHELKTRRKRPSPISLFTANGTVSVTEEINIYVADLGIHVWAQLMHTDTPAVLSLGRLVNEEDFTYIWKPQNPAVLLRGQQRVVCEEQIYVPYVYPANVAAPGKSGKKKSKSKSKPKDDPDILAIIDNAIASATKPNANSGADQTAAPPQSTESSLPKPPFEIKPDEVPPPPWIVSQSLAFHH